MWSKTPIRDSRFPPHLTDFGATQEGFDSAADIANTWRVGRDVRPVWADVVRQQFVRNGLRNGLRLVNVLVHVLGAWFLFLVFVLVLSAWCLVLKS